uniref:Nephrocystin 3-like N-terminal domain-containing protein n=1 Tax=Coccidioides posadasii RMSCC 3488 TaxID=454284 RepID=A0A0J6FGG0_COCPO|nr:hypothetical protein CPAG_08509 [Coccidioides posadasii RMSCC 3488]
MAYLDQSTIVISALIALAIAIWCHPLSSRSSGKLPPKPKRALTLRVDEVPIDKAHAAFKSDLETIIGRDQALENDTISILQHLLVRRDRKVACGTATFYTSIPASELLTRLHRASFGFQYRFDIKFYGITPLYETGGAADVDVIAVPGLGSHAIGSWKSSSNNDLWLRDYLPDHIPDIRVLLYGYDSTLQGSDSKDSIEDLGTRFLETVKAFRADMTDRRPIIFIGHSLGGLLIKEALVRASRKFDDPQNHRLCTACYGLLLFGVPNLGLRNEQLSSIVKGQPNEGLIRDLVVDRDSEPSPFLKRISGQFSESCKGRYRIQPDGTLAKTGQKMFMVTEKSATSTGLTAVADENNIPLNTDHSGLVKYESKSQEEYLIVKEKLKLLVTEASQEVPKRFSQDSLTPKQQHLWNDLNQPPYTSFRNSSKLAKPEKGTLEWLNQTEDTDHNVIVQRHLSSASLHMEDFKSWRDSNKSESLLVTAPPGRGKSVLSNFVLGHLESRIPQTTLLPTKIIYYFCNIKNEEVSRNARSVLRALIIQLCEHQRHLFQLLPSEYQRTSERFFSAPFETLLHIFRKLLRENAYASVYCVIDGLDVYKDEMDELITKLIEDFNPESTAETSVVLKLFCTSRPERHILDLWKRATHRILRCHPHDLNLFINSRLEGLEEKFNDDMKQTIKTQLSQGANDTFLWLEVVLRRIRAIKLPSLKRITETIKNSPQDLDELYQVIIGRLLEEDIDSARFLAWVVYAKYPLDLETLADAVAIDPRKKYKTYTDCLQDRPHLTPDEVHKDFGMLVDVIGGKIFLIHQSVKDYFESHNPLQPLIGIHPRLALTHITMAYLSLDEFRLAKKNIMEQKYPLLEYAATNWYSHIEAAAEINCHHSIKDFLKTILPPSPNAQVWLSVDQYIRLFPNYLPTSRASEISIRFDIKWLAELLLNEELPEVKDDFDRDCLSAAAAVYGGRVLKALLEHEKGIQFKISGDIVEKIAGMHHYSMMNLLLDRRGADIKITENVLKAAAGNEYSGKEVMALLLNQQDADIKITEMVLKAAAENQKSGKEVMALLLNQQDTDIKITEEVLKAAAGNEKSGKEVMALLLNQQDADIKITEEVLKAAARNWYSGKEVMALLLNQQDADIKITEEVLKAAAENQKSGKEVMALLLNQQDTDIKITEEVLKAAAENQKSGKEVMALLLNQQDTDIKITEEVLKAAAGNERSGKEVMALLLNQQDADIKITEKVLKAAAGNKYSGKKVMALLLNQQDTDIKITEDVLKAAAGNKYSGKKVMTLLLNQQDADIKITENVLKAAAGNKYSGKQVMALLLKYQSTRSRH